VRRALVEATDALLTCGAAVTLKDWDRPATDRWTVRQLLAHVVRSLAVVGELLDADLDPQGPPLTGPTGYYRAALDHAGAHDGIAGRATEAASATDRDPMPWARDVVAALLDRVAVTPGDRPFVHLVGWLPFDEYLVTRVVEVVLHTFDLQLACGLTPSAPGGALAVVDPFLVDLADRADPTALALALTGRSSSTVCNVLG
jgi:uncharacterized protein (TIGR03083 family)